MPKYKLINCREERAKNRDFIRQKIEFKKSIFKKNETIIDLRKEVLKYRDLYSGIEEAFNFSYSAYTDLYKMFSNTSNKYKKIITDYNQLLDEYLEELIENEEN